MIGTPITYDEIKALIKMVKKRIKEIKKIKSVSIDPDFNESMSRVLRDSKNKAGRSVIGAKNVIVN